MTGNNDFEPLLRKILFPLSLIIQLDLVDLCYKYLYSLLYFEFHESKFMEKCSLHNYLHYVLDFNLSAYKA